MYVFAEVYFFIYFTLKTLETHGGMDMRHVNMLVDKGCRFNWESTQNDDGRALRKKKEKAFDK